MEKKRGILYWLRVILCLFAIIAMGFRFAGIKVSADEITLSYEQSLALFGSTIEGTYYSTGLNQDIPCYAVYAGRSSDYVPSDHWGGYYDYGHTQWSWVHNGSTSTGSNTLNFPIPDMYDKDYLIYRVCSTSSGTGFPSWTSSNVSGHVNLSIQFPFLVQSVSDIQFSVLQSYSPPAGYYAGPSISKCIFNTSFSSVDSFQAIGQYNYSSRIQSFLTTIYKQSWYGDIPVGSTPLPASQIPEDYRVSMVYMPVKCNYNNENFSVSGFQLSLNCVGAVDNDLTYNGFLNGGYSPLLFIQCPTLSDYVPATTPAVTARPRETMQPAQSTAAQVTVDLSTLESGVAAIVEQQVEMNNNLDWIGNNIFIGVNNLAYIANRLDDIFDNMVRNGDISLDLVAADRLQDLRSDIHGSIHDSLTTFTTAQIPNDASSGFSFYNDLFSRFTSGDLAFFGWLGGFSLVTLVLGWFLFKGRG